MTLLPFVKVEATKFTEVGYVGRDVESMVRDLVETSIRIVKEEKIQSVKEVAEANANKRLVELLVPSAKKNNTMKNPFEMFFGGNTTEDEQQSTAEETTLADKRSVIRQKLEADHYLQSD